MIEREGRPCSRLFRFARRGMGIKQPFVWLEEGRGADQYNLRGTLYLCRTVFLSK